MNMWRFVGSSADGERFLIEGVNVWDFSWQHIPGEYAHVEDPHYHQKFTFDVSTITDGERTIKFAAGEFSNGIWGFYVMNSLTEKTGK